MPVGGDADGDGKPDHHVVMTGTLSRAQDTMQAQIARVQMALDPPERGEELIEIGRTQADKALDAAGY